MTRTIARAAAAAFVVFALWVPRQALALPDLIAEVFDLGVIVTDVAQEDVDEGCAGGTQNRRLIDFSLRTRNVGADDLILGNPGCPNCTLNPGAACSNPLFECGTSHGHAHFESFARTELLDANGNVVAQGSKYGFCLLDLECDDPQYSCSFQGISAGCSDVYASGLPCQYVDITDAAVPDGLYTLRVTVDPDGEIAEASESNNTIEVPLEIGSTPPVCPEYASTDVPKNIPDESSITSTLVLPDLGNVTSMRVRLAGEHSYVGDLQARLISPASTEVRLVDQICSSDNDFDLYLGDEATTAIPCPATDPSTLKQPAEPLAAFLGEDAQGTWTLHVEDLEAQDDGVLESWSLEVCTICGNGTVDMGEICDDGNALNGDCCSADCQTIGADGTPCASQNQCMVGGTCSSGTCQGGFLLECDPCLTCDPDAGCVVPGDIYPCQDAAPAKSVLVLKNGSVDEADSIIWKWKSQTPVALDEFGAPQASTELTLCVYDASGLVLSATAQSGSDCADGACWDVRDTSAAYTEEDGAVGGLTSIRIKEGTQGKIVLKGRGEMLGVPPLFLPLPATVRLKRNDGTPCWQARFTDPATNAATLFKSRSD
ncbi:MAG TPA: lysyl oxidase family protein [Candidatus Limnocylindrales bacterium]|nr:lysyl oxidase family protein [Candidatus Limnocylindrales bacterium]